MLTYPLLLCNPELAFEDTVVTRLQRTPGAPLSQLLLARPTLRRVALRSLFVLFTGSVTLALKTPAYFGPFLNLVASCTATFANFVLPSAFYMKIRGTREMPRLEIAWNVLIIVFAFIGAGRAPRRPPPPPSRHRLPRAARPHCLPPPPSRLRRRLCDQRLHRSRPQRRRLSRIPPSAALPPGRTASRAQRRPIADRRASV